MKSQQVHVTSSIYDGSSAGLSAGHTPSSAPNNIVYTHHTLASDTSHQIMIDKLTQASFVLPKQTLCDSNKKLFYLPMT